MGKRITKLWKDKRGSSFPLAIAITLSLVVIFCGISEYLRLYLIAAGVRDAVEDAVISAVNDKLLWDIPRSQGRVLRKLSAGWERRMERSNQ